MSNSLLIWHGKPIRFLTLCLIIVASGILYHPVVDWWVIRMTSANGYLSLITWLGLSGLGAYRLANMSVIPFHYPVPCHTGALIWLSASGLYLFNEAEIGFHTLSAGLFVIYIYGLAGHYLSANSWRSLLLPMLLLILLLPFEHYLDTYLGFPLRLLSANWASSLLQLAQLPLLTIESILMIDNKAAIVDIDCSGIKSLWSGLIFYLLLSWLEQCVINLRWILIGFGLMALLVISNVFRIVILVLLDRVLGWSEIAQLFHQSLGLLGFIISCLIVWRGLLTLTKKSKIDTLSTELKPLSNSYTSSIILGLITGLIILYQPYQTSIRTNIPHRLDLPSAYPFETTELSQQENTFFASNNAHAQKYTINIQQQDRAIQVSMVLVWSQAWKAHHIPENCYLSQGYSISDTGIWRMNQLHTVRYLSLNKSTPGHKRVSTRTGAYWFQSASHSTTDYSSRVMDHFAHPDREWVMVSMLWDRVVDPDEISTFITIVEQSLGDILNAS